jgi:hypothetical protein
MTRIKSMNPSKNGTKKKNEKKKKKSKRKKGKYKEDVLLVLEAGADADALLEVEAAVANNIMVAVTTNNVIVEVGIAAEVELRQIDDSQKSDIIRRRDEAEVAVRVQGEVGLARQRGRIPVDLHHPNLSSIPQHLPLPILFHQRMTSLFRLRLRWLLL